MPCCVALCMGEMICCYNEHIMGLNMLSRLSWRSCSMVKLKARRWTYKPFLPLILLGNVNSFLNNCEELEALIKNQWVHRECSLMFYQDVADRPHPGVLYWPAWLYFSTSGKRPKTEQEDQRQGTCCHECHEWRQSRKCCEIADPTP